MSSSGEDFEEDVDEEKDEVELWRFFWSWIYRSSCDLLLA
jgi:hypothetical protein